MGKKISDAAKGIKEKATGFGAVLAASVTASPVRVMANSGSTSSFSGYNAGTGSDIIGNLSDVVANVATYIGAIFLIVGVLTFFIAFRNEDSEGKNRAGIGIAASIGLLAFGQIMDMFI